MSASTSSNRLQRKIVIFSTAGIFLISTVVATVSIVPLYKQLFDEQEKSLVFAATTKTMAIEEFLRRSKDITIQITSRTKLREKLEAYNAKAIALEEILPFFNKALGDALSTSEELAGIARLDRDGEAVTQLGIDIPRNLWPIPERGSKQLRVEGPVKLEGNAYLVIGAPILGKTGQRIGTDIVLFEIEKLRRIVDDYSGLGKTGETVIGRLAGKQVIPLTPSRRNESPEVKPIEDGSDLATAVKRAVNKESGLIKPETNTAADYVIAYRPIKDSNWGVAVKMDERELYESIQQQVATTAILILGLIIAGTLGTVFLLRPLAGKVILHTSELEQKITEKTAALAEKEARIRSIVETAADGIISIDEHGVIELFNPAAERIFGYRAPEVIGSNVSVLMPEPQRGRHDGYIEDYLRTGEGKILGTGGREVEGVDKDGGPFPMELTVSELCIDGHRKFTGMIRDITDRKQAQLELSRRYEELKTANDQLKSAQSQLLQSEKMASIGQLAAGVAHEINNPVGYINSNVGALQQYIEDLFRVLEGYERLEEEVQSESALAQLHAVKDDVDLTYLKRDIAELISESQEGVTRVKQIVQDLKDFSRVDEAERQWADLHKGIDSTLSVASNEIKYKADVVRDYGDIPRVECIPSQLNQVFLNLLVNAAHAIEGRGVITIRSGCEGESVWVSISDTGRGIPEEIQNRIFEPFFTTKSIGQGTGLGLSLSYGIVEKHGGRIELDSVLGKGTTFTVWVPIEQAQA